jgi:uncharacterized protein (TIGR03083 family)
MTFPAELIRTERASLIELLETLTPAEWATPSLCGAWTVQQVAAHLAWAPTLSGREFLPELVRSRFRINETNARLGVRWAERGTAAILDQHRRNLTADAKPKGVPGEAPLEDAVVHGLDIRRPLGRSRPIPRDAFALTAEFQLATRWPISVSVGGNVRRRVQGLRLVAHDLEWSHGHGAEVRGSAEALLLMLSGRAIGDDELTGPGAPVLYERL